MGIFRHLTTQMIVDVVIWSVASLPVLVLFLVGVPREVGFFCDDQSLMYPYREDTVTIPVVACSGYAVTIVMMVLIECLLWLDKRRERCGCCSISDIPYYVKGFAVFLVGFTINQMFIDSVKNATGKLRPNFFDVCRPDFNRTDCAGRYITADMYNCTSTEYSAKDIRDSRHAFPSGHAQLSSYVAVYLSLYIQRRLVVSFSYVLPIMLQAILILVAALCGVNRIQDNKHHPSDVIAGFIIGAMVAFAVFWTIARRVLAPRRMMTSDSNQTTEEGTPGDNDRSEKALIAQQPGLALTGCDVTGTAIGIE